MSTYKIIAEIYDEYKIQIKVMDSKKQIVNKFINLDFNGNKAPTFAESRYEYSPEDFLSFIKSVESKSDGYFAFDYNNDDTEDMGVFDGMFFHYKNNTPTILFTVSQGKTNMSVHLDISKCYKSIISDLHLMRKVIDEFIISKLNYLEYLENYDVDNNNITTNDKTINNNEKANNIDK